MCVANPRFIPRNHLLKNALDAAEEGDMVPFNAILAVVRDPYGEHPPAYGKPGGDGKFVTYCGT